LRLRGAAQVETEVLVEEAGGDEIPELGLVKVLERRLAAAESVGGAWLF